MLSLDAPSRVIHASSFSKTVSPGVRVGYLAGPAEQIRRSPSAAPSTTSRRTCWPSRWSSSSAAPAPSPRNIEFVNGALRERRDALVEALREQIPEAEFVVPGGGYFLWLDLADDVDTPALLEAAKEEGVAFVAGPDFMLEGGALEPAPLVRQRARRAGRRGRRAARPGARGAARRRAGLVRDPAGCGEICAPVLFTKC